MRSPHPESTHFIILVSDYICTMTLEHMRMNVQFAKTIACTHTHKLHNDKYKGAKQHRHACLMVCGLHQAEFTASLISIDSPLIQFSLLALNFCQVQNAQCVTFTGTEW